MMDSIVLMIGLGFIEGFQCDDLGDNRPFEDAGFVKLSDISVGDSLLLGVAVKDCRSILRAGVRSLSIQFGRIVGHSKIHFKQLAIRNPRWIIFDPDRLSVSGIAFAYHLVVSRVSRPS